MTISRRQKLIIIALLIYWPAIFILGHVPIPELIRKAGVSDKVLHFLTYLILLFLLWSAISPDMKVKWRRAAAWWVLLVTVWYGVVDEVLQGFVVGRSCDVMDFFADLAGVTAGLIIFTFFTFWPAFLVVTGITIFALTNLTRVNLADLMPVTNAAFYLFAYPFFTLLWIQNMHILSPLKPPESKWLILASVPPIGLLLTVKVFSIISDRGGRLQDTIIAAVGIAAAVFTIYLIGLCRCRRSKCPTAT